MENYAILINYKPLTVIQNGHICYVTANSEQLAKQLCNSLSCMGTVGYMLLNENGKAYIDKCIGEVCKTIIDAHNNFDNINNNPNDINLPGLNATIYNIPKGYNPEFDS